MRTEPCAAEKQTSTRVRWGALHGAAFCCSTAANGLLTATALTHTAGGCWAPQHQACPGLLAEGGGKGWCHPAAAQPGCLRALCTAMGRNAPSFAERNPSARMQVDHLTQVTVLAGGCCKNISEQGKGFLTEQKSPFCLHLQERRKTGNKIKQLSTQLQPWHHQGAGL